MPRELFELELDELSLVDRPANQEAMVSLFKRDNSQEDTMEELQQEIEALKADKTKLETELATEKTETARLTKALNDAEYDVTAEAITKRAAVEQIEVEGVKVNKADIPAPVLKALETAAVEKAELVLTKRAETEFPNFKVEVAKSLIKSIGNDTEVMNFLKTADKLLAKMQEETGTQEPKGDMLDANTKLENLAKAYAAEHKVTYAKGYQAVMKTDAGKALYQELSK